METVAILCIYKKDSDEMLGMYAYKNEQLAQKAIDSLTPTQHSKYDYHMDVLEIINK